MFLKIFARFICRIDMFIVWAPRVYMYIEYTQSRLLICRGIYVVFNVSCCVLVVVSLVPLFSRFTSVWSHFTIAGNLFVFLLFLFPPRSYFVVRSVSRIQRSSYAFCNGTKCHKHCLLFCIDFSHRSVPIRLRDNVYSTTAAHKRIPIQLSIKL